MSKYTLKTDRLLTKCYFVKVFQFQGKIETHLKYFVLYFVPVYGQDAFVRNIYITSKFMTSQETPPRKIQQSTAATLPEGSRQEEYSSAKISQNQRKKATKNIAN